MIALFWKEIRGLRVFLLAVLALLLLGHIYTLATEFPDSRPFTASRILDDVSPTLTVAFLGLVLGAGLLIREERDRTLFFLDALPVSRTAVFIAKVAAGVVVMTFAGAFELGIEAVFGWLSRTSIDGPAPVRFTFTLIGLLAITSSYAMGVGFVLSFLRRWFALVLGLIVWALLWFAGQGVSWIEILQPTKLVPSVVGEDVKVPWNVLHLHGALAGAALIVSWFLFLHLGMSVEDVGRRWRAVVNVLLVVATPLAWFGVVTALDRLGGGPEDDYAALRADAFAQHKTASYHFLFRESQREFTGELIQEADAVFADVAGYFPGIGFGGNLIVDLASPLPPHAAGVTNWTQIRVPLWRKTPREELLPVLAHETAHAFQAQLGTIRYLEAARWIRFFNEGLATHIGLQQASDEEVASYERLIAAAASRGKVPFSELLDNKELSKSRDPEIVYPMGLAFCRALEEVGGEEVFYKLIAAFPNLPGGVKRGGGELWRQICAAAEVDLDRVIAAYDEEVDAQVMQHANFVRGFPRLSGTVSREGAEIVIRATHEGRAQGNVVCCLAEAGLFGSEKPWYFADKDGVIRIPRSDVPTGTVRYMLGWSSDELPWPVFEPWATATVD
jgi:ABC-type transport system involved in multi-copper enzyme maturation permease subunit